MYDTDLVLLNGKLALPVPRSHVMCSPLPADLKFKGHICLIYSADLVGECLFDGKLCAVSQERS